MLSAEKIRQRDLNELRGLEVVAQADFAEKFFTRRK